MAKFIRWELLRGHHVTGIEQVRAGEETHRAVERVQREWGRDGQLAPIKYQVHEGDVISALIASAKAEQAVRATE